MRSSTFHLWPWLVPSRLCATHTAGARRFPPSHDIPRSTRGSLRETTGMSQPLTRVASDLFSEHANYKSQLKHSRFCLVNNAPPSPTPPSPLGRIVAWRDKNGCVGDKQMCSKSGAKTRVKASERAPPIFALGKQKPPVTQAFWAVPHFPQNILIHLFFCPVVYKR